MFDPFAGRHPPPPTPPLPMVGLPVLYPVRCLRCRRRLRSVATGYRRFRNDRHRWCKNCRWLVSYDEDE